MATTHQFTTEPTRWDVWLNRFDNYGWLFSSALAGVVEGSGLGYFVADCASCGTPLGDSKAGPDLGYGHPAKTFKSRNGARLALSRHYSKQHTS